MPQEQSPDQIVVIDDESYVRDTLEQMLISLGYRVRSFDDCEPAVHFYRQHQSEVSLVIMDLMMPRSSGKECFTAIQALNPDVKAILASGLAQDRAVQEALDLGMAGFLQKPFQLATLRETIARVLSGSRSA